MNSNFLQLAKEMPNTIFHLSAKDLLDFANEILEGAKLIAQLELEKAQYCDELLTIEEVCEMLKVSKMTLHRWDKQGILCKIEVGGKRRYRKSDVERATAGRTKNDCFSTRK